MFIHRPGRILAEKTFQEDIGLLRFEQTKNH
jgi:hypothetical protein